MKKEKVGEIITIILFAIFILITLYVAANRVERIENDEMTLVNQNQMDR